MKNKILNVRDDVVLVMNIPSPYKIPMLNNVSKKYNGNFTVIYCAEREPDREWDLPKIEYNCIFLKERIIIKGGKYIHNNPDIFKHLNRINPSVVITAGFNPTFLYAFLWAMIKRKKHIGMSEGNIFSESFLTWKHRVVRKIVYKLSKSFIGASNGTKKLFMSYAIPERKIFISQMSIDNDKYAKCANTKKKVYDVMFSGQFIERKMPLFFIDVVKILKREKKDLKVLIIGSGPLKNMFLRAMDTHGIEYDYPGFIMQDDLPRYYASSKVLLFPTKYDTWGIVANEACAAGVPVVTCDNAGVANDLVVNGSNGYVLPLNSDIWSEKILELLRDDSLYNNMSKAAIEKVKEYNFEIAAQHFVEAIELGLKSNNV